MTADSSLMAALSQYYGGNTPEMVAQADQTSPVPIPPPAGAVPTAIQAYDNAQSPPAVSAPQGDALDAAIDSVTQPTNQQAQPQAAIDPLDQAIDDHVNGKSTSSDVVANSDAPNDVDTGLFSPNVQTSNNIVGLWDSAKKNLAARSQEAASIIKDHSGSVSDLDEILPLAGVAAKALVSDPLSGAISEVGNTTGLSKLVGLATDVIGSGLANTSIGRGILSGVNDSENWVNSHPDLKANIGGALNVAGAAAPFESVLGKAADTVDAASDIGSDIKTAGKEYLDNRASKDPLSDVPSTDEQEEESLTPNQTYARNLAGPLYDKADSLGSSFSPEGYDSFLKNIPSKLVPTTGPAAKNANNEISNYINGLKEHQGNPVTFQEYRDLDSQLSDKYNDSLDAGKPTATSRAYAQIRGALNNTFSNESLDKNPNFVIGSGNQQAMAALKDANNIWSQSYNLGEIDKIDRAAQVAGNPAGTIQSKYAALYRNVPKFSKFSPDEQDLIQQAATPGIGPKALQLVGSKAAVGVGTLLHGPVGGGLAYGVGGLANKAAEALKARPVNALTEGIRSRIEDIAAQHLPQTGQSAAIEPIIQNEAQAQPSVQKPKRPNILGSGARNASLSAALINATIAKQSENKR